MMELRAGTPAAEIGLKNLQAELDGTIIPEIELLEQRLPSLEGADRSAAVQQLAQLEWRKARCEETKRRLTFDLPKRLRAAVCSIDQICDAVDHHVPFLGTSRRSWLGYGIAGSADTHMLEAIAIAISRLKANDHRLVMDHVRRRAMAAPREPGEPMVF